MATPSEYFDNADINNIPVPDWSHLDVTSPSNNPTLMLTWDDVMIDDEWKDSIEVFAVNSLDEVMDLSLVKNERKSEQRSSNAQIKRQRQ